MTEATGLPQIEGYQVEREIGRGGFSRVYEGEHSSVGRKVAIKVLKERLVDEAAAQGFEQECKAMGAVRHPNVVAVRDAVFTVDRRPCIVMELYSRGNYGARLLQQGALPIDELLRLGIKIAAGLATAHALNIVHGDVKPQNIFRSQFGDVALGDFGIATVDQASGSQAAGFTPHYAAPELIEDGMGAAGPLSDQYSLGATLFHLAAGARPFWIPGENETEQILLRVVSDPTPVLPPRCGAELAAVVAKAMARDPQDRYPDIEAMAHALGLVERKLGLPPTPIMIGTDDDNTIDAFVVEDTASAPSPDGVASDFDTPAQATAPLSPVAEAESQPPAQVPSQPEALDALEQPSAAPALAQPTPPTSASSTAHAEAAPADSAPVSSRRSLFAAGGLVAAATLLGLVIFFSSRPDQTDPADAPPPQTTVAFDDDFYAVVPPVDDLVGTLIGESAAFRWSSAGTGLRFEVKRTDSSAANTSRTVDTSSIEYQSLDAGERPCVQVRAVNASNGSVSQWSGTTCAEDNEDS